MSHSRFVALLVWFLCTVLMGNAAADVVQPDGKLIPVVNPGGQCHDSSNMGACLDDGEVALGGMAGTIDAVHDAHVDQETYDPGCQLTFKVISYGTSIFSHVFGWYVAKPGSNTPPALSDLHVFMDCTETKTIGISKTLVLPPGTGSIGFFVGSGFGGCPEVNANGMLDSEPDSTSYTERRLNGKLRNGDPDPFAAQGYYRVLTYQSVAQPASFYFAWEDEADAGSDDNFEDLVTWVSGISCSAGGAPCDTGQKGLCGPGTKQCRGGALTCIGDRTPTPEKCNGVDDNCDGNVDEGNLCDPKYVCYHGNCVPNCGGGEFPCPPGTACQADVGYCVDVACTGVTCPAGQVCRAGACVAECLGVKCPFGQACRQGNCVDVCASLTCDTDFVCVPLYSNGADKDPSGVCTNCGCQGCAAGTRCVDRHCVPNDCSMVTCGAGTHCVGGTCVDNCAGAVCPPSQKCEKGACVPDPTAPRDAGVEAGIPPILATSSSTTIGSGGSPAGSGSSGSGGATGGSGGSTPRGRLDEASCGCRMPGARSSGSSAAILAMLCFVSLGRRRGAARRKGELRLAKPLRDRRADVPVASSGVVGGAWHSRSRC
jgi:hypothetical protein